MTADKIFCDDTPLPVLDRTRKRTRIGRLWCYAVDDRPWRGSAPPVVVYLYAQDRQGCHLEAHLVSFQGVLQVDGYAGYGHLAKPPCNRRDHARFLLAHARRMFFEVTSGRKTL